MNCFLRIIVIAIITAGSAVAGFGQRPSFTSVYNVRASSCKDQANSSTCWSFATTSFIESECYRISGKDYDLSEMFFVRQVYPEKAVNYVRWHGHTFFTPGGQPHDIMTIIRSKGFVPENVYKSTKPGKWLPDHSELDTLIRTITFSLAGNEKASASGAWLNAIEKILDEHLGQIPQSFEYAGKEMTPVAFAESTGLDPDDYIEITSYTHHPYFKPFALETKYNWSHDLYYNVPFQEFAGLFESALKNGYSIVYNGDVSEKEFSPDEGMAVLPVRKWNDKTALEQKQTFLGRETEIEASAQVRQQMFDARTTTVDHVMHITGLVKDATGKKYYVVKNSWGDPASNGGLIYMSESYLLLKCVSVMINKKALQPGLRKKLNID